MIKKFLTIQVWLLIAMVFILGVASVPTLFIQWFIARFSIVALVVTIFVLAGILAALFLWIVKDTPDQF